MPRTLANGKICYIEMPATDIARSSDFYKQVFGWNIRKRGERGDGSVAFDDPTGEVSGTWVIGCPRAATVSRPLLTWSLPTRARCCSPSALTRPRSLRGFATRREM